MENPPQVSLSETSLWRAFEVYRRLDVARLAAAGGDGSAHATTDVPIQVMPGSPAC